MSNEAITLHMGHDSFIWVIHMGNFQELNVSARNASWNPVGVEPIHRKPADIEPGSLMSGTYRKVR